jgi:hypothetical protein
VKGVFRLNAGIPFLWYSSVLDGCSLGRGSGEQVPLEQVPSEPVFFEKNPLAMSGFGRICVERFETIIYRSKSRVNGRFVLYAVNKGRRREASPNSRFRGTTPAGIAGVSKLWRVINDY